MISLPRGVCPHCMLSYLECKRAMSTGKICTCSIMHAAPKPAYVIGSVTLEEGGTKMTMWTVRRKGEGRLQAERGRRQPTGFTPV